MIKNPQDIVVFMEANQVSASLKCPVATYTFPFNPDEVKWNLINNTVSRDTIGGRVVQLLSSRVEQMTVTGRAGSRGELQNLALNMKKIMKYQIELQNPVHFIVPSRRWDFKVYIQNISSLGWDYAATSYPYEITLLVQEDLTGLAKKEIEEDALERLAQGISYSEELHGGNSEDALSTSEVYLNSVGFLKSKNQGSTSTEETGEVVNPGGTGTGTGQRTPTPTGTGNATLTKALLAKADLSTAPSIPSDVRFLTIKQIYELAYWALNQLGSASKEIAIIMTAISCVETQSHDTQAQAQAINDIAYGLWQMNEGYGTSLWDPIVSALHMAEKYYAVGYDYWGPGPTNKGTYQSWMDEARAAAA